MRGFDETEDDEDVLALLELKSEEDDEDIPTFVGLEDEAEKDSLKKYNDNNNIIIENDIENLPTSDRIKFIDEKQEDLHEVINKKTAVEPFEVIIFLPLHFLINFFNDIYLIIFLYPIEHDNLCHKYQPQVSNIHNKHDLYLHFFFLVIILNSSLYM